MTLTWLREKEGAALPEGKESDKSFLKGFTERQIGVIMDSEFGGRITEFVNLIGNKQITENGRVQEITAVEALKRSVMYAVFTRCGFDLPTEKQDFSFITAFTTEEEVYRLGSLLSDISCEVLRGIANDLKQMEERSIAILTGAWQSPLRAVCSRKLCGRWRQWTGTCVMRWKSI